jgi:hypothetical protein
LIIFQNNAITLRLNFGGGLVQQSESQNVVAGEVTYVQKVLLALCAGGRLALPLAV